VPSNETWKPEGSGENSEEGSGETNKPTKPVVPVIVVPVKDDSKKNPWKDDNFDSFGDSTD